MELNFSNLVVASRGRKAFPNVTDAAQAGLILAGQDGTNLVEGSAQYGTTIDSIQAMMREIGNTQDVDMHTALGAAVREPIRTLARYKAWTQIFFAEDPRGPADDNRIPVDQPIGKAYATSPEGRPQLVRLGAQQWVRPTFSMLSTGLEVPWGILKTAGWAVLSRRMEESSDDLARKMDTKAKTALVAALLAGQTVSSSGSLLKSAVDYVIKQSTMQGFPVVQAAINTARMMDMTGWTNGSTSALPYIWGPDKGDELFRNLFAQGYGNINWFLSHSVPYTEVWLSGAPAEVGYHQTHGAPQSASQVDVMRMVDQHITYQDDAWYVGNAYNVWKIEIT